MNLKQTSIQRAQDIINTTNSKFKKFYYLDENSKNKLYFWCENCYRLYFIETLPNEQYIAVISDFIEQLKENGFEKAKELPSYQVNS